MQFGGGRRAPIARSDDSVRSQPTSASSTRTVAGIRSRRPPGTISTTSGIRGVLCTCRRVHDRSDLTLAIEMLGSGARRVRGAADHRRIGRSLDGRRRGAHCDRMEAGRADHHRQRGRRATARSTAGRRRSSRVDEQASRCPSWSPISTTRCSMVQAQSRGRPAIAACSSCRSRRPPGRRSSVRWSRGALRPSTSRLRLSHRFTSRSRLAALAIADHRTKRKLALGRVSRSAHRPCQPRRVRPSTR